VTPSKSDEPVGTPPPMIEITEQKEQRLVFEPYHTVDYFASQGIRNIVEDKPKDRFSQQLRSFTEWLKTIRQMPTEQIVAMSDGKSDEKVVQLASHSIEDRNVETEAMAEVWIKQGRHEKAIEIYQKLSLLNPSKSSYFALLIEKLKKN
jgi:tetratricopeptide (TPR) repeat protein